MGGAMQRDDRLAGARGTGHPRRARVVALDPFALRGVQEDRPLIPGIVQRLLERLDIRHQAEASLRIRVSERIGARRRLTNHRPAAGCQLKQCFGSFGGQMAGEIQQALLIDVTDGIQPVRWHAIAEQFLVRAAGEERR